MRRWPANTRRSAFTLLEIAVVLVMVGFMFTLATQTGKSVEGETNCVVTTREQLTVIKRSIDTYVGNNGEYPIPAVRNVATTSIDYGKATALADIANIDTLSSTIYAGALPTQALGLSADYAADCWGNKFSYFVSKDLTATDAANSATTVGAITIRAGTIQNPVDIMSGAAYAVISHGEVPVCGVAKNYAGVSHGWRSAAPANGDPVDYGNCDGATTAPATDNTSLYDATFNSNASTSATFFDDLVIFGGKTHSNCNKAAGYDVVWGTGDACSAHVSGNMTHLATQPVTDLAHSGTATAECVDGEVQIQPSAEWHCNSCSGSSGGHGGGGAVCAAPCSTSTLTWSSEHCSASFIGISSGATSVSTDNTAVGYTGAATATCTGGAWDTPAGTCNANCATSTLSWGAGCSASFTGIDHGASSASTSNTATSYTGSATASCSNGTWSAPSGTCLASCATSTLTWNGATTGCAASFTAIASGATSASTSNTAANKTGSATATCTDGTWGTPTGTCAADCAADTLSWGTGCSASFTGIASGVTSASTSNTASGYSGSAAALCTNGTWGTPSGTCTADSCSTSTLSWGGSCSASFTGIASGATSPSTSNTVSGYTGTATATCTAGTWSTPSGTCTPSPCAATSLSWGGVTSGCSATFAAAASGTTSPSTSNTAANKTGSATATCTNGTWGAASGTCAASCTTSTLSWSGAVAGCSASFTTIADGATSASTPTTVLTKTGSATATCTNGTWGAASGTCATAASCPAQTINWGSGCTASFPLTASGSTAGIANTTSGKWGQGNQSCYNGTFSLSASSCNACAGTNYAAVSTMSMCWYVGAAGQSCDTVCGSHGGHYLGGTATIGSNGNDARCLNTMNAVLGGSYAAPSTAANALGCYLDTGTGLLVRGTVTTTSSSSAVNARRICACAS